MTFFYDLNKRLADLATKQDATRISEDAKAVAPTSKLAQALNERDMGKHNNATTGFAALAKKAGKEYGSKAAGERVAGAQFQKMKKSGKLEERSMDEAVRGLNFGDQGYQPPTTQAQRDATAKGIKQNRTINRADTRVTGYGNRVEPQQGAASGRGYNTGVTAQKTQPSYGGQETPVDFKPSGDYVNPKHIDNYGNLQIKPGQGKGVAKEGQINELSPELLKRASDAAGMKYAHADDRRDKKASEKYSAQSDKFHDAMRRKQKQKDMNEADLDEVSRGEYIKQHDATAEKSGKQKFNAFGQTFNTDEIDEGFKEMDAWMAQREKEKGTGKFDKKERTLPGGMKATTYTRRHDDEEDKDDEAKSDAPKKKGRPTGPAKGPERVTAKSYKYKAGRPTKTKEGLDSDGVMMTRPSAMSSESVSPAEQGEYNDEAGMTKDSLHTIVRHAKELEKCLRDNENLPEWVQEKVGQIKGMMSSVTDYIISTHERDAEQHMGREGITIEPMAEGIDKAQAQAVYNELGNLRKFAKQVQGGGQFPQGFASQLESTLWSAMKLIQAQQPNDAQVFEKAVSKAQRKFMGMAHAIQKGEKIKGAGPELKKVAKSMKSSDTHDFAATKEKGLPKKVKEESTDREDQRAEKAGRRVAKDIEYDEGHKAKGDNKAERAGKRVTKDIEYDDKKDRKEKKVDETTVAGSVATATASGKPGKGGMTFGKGVYEGYNQQFTQALNESISIESKMQECGDGNMSPGITIQADGEEANKLMMLLKLAGLEGCPTCGRAPCGCEELDENSPDWPTNTEKLAAEPNLRTYSGGLNGPKSTGQTTVPVVASQLRRQASMEESVELERSLFKTWKNYKG
jgi:hypothetical protein